MKIIRALQSVHARLIREAADDYIRKGYSVIIKPRDEELPSFLESFDPDMIVYTPEGSFVADVKIGDRVRGEEYWKRLHEAIKTQPGWQSVFITDNGREQELVQAEKPVISPEEVESRLQTGQQLAEQGLLDSALIVIWAALEAVLRDLSRKEGLHLPYQGSAPLVTAMYTQGSLERSDYDTLMAILEARNQAAHGFQVENLERSLVEKAQKIAQRLLRKQRRKKKVA